MKLKYSTILSPLVRTLFRRSPLGSVGHSGSPKRMFSTIEALRIRAGISSKEYSKLDSQCNTIAGIARMRGGYDGWSQKQVKEFMMEDELYARIEERRTEEKETLQDRKSQLGLSESEYQALEKDCARIAKVACESGGFEGESPDDVADDLLSKELDKRLAKMDVSDVDEAQSHRAQP